MAGHKPFAACAALVAVAAFLALAFGLAPGLAPAAPAAVGHRPKGDYAPFADCPLGDAQTEVCIFAQTEGGELAIGSRTIPLRRTMTLQGGVHEDEASGKQTFIPAEGGGVGGGDGGGGGVGGGGGGGGGGVGVGGGGGGEGGGGGGGVGVGGGGGEGGETLSRTPQAIPGTDLTIAAPKSLPRFAQEMFNEFVDQRTTTTTTGLTATTELAGTASSVGIDTQNLIEAKGTGLRLPVKVRLSNPLVGEDCYVGSNAHPIYIPFTTGFPHSSSGSSSHGPVNGKPGHAQFKDEYNLVTIKEDSLLNDSFAAPRAEGCGGILAFLVDPAVNAELGVPLAAGHNRAVLDVTLRDANASAVKASE